MHTLHHWSVFFFIRKLFFLVCLICQSVCVNCLTLSLLHHESSSNNCWFNVSGGGFDHGFLTDGWIPAPHKLGFWVPTGVCGNTAK